MIKKTFAIVLCLFFLFSCGKKADPEYYGMYHLWKKRVQSWMADGSWLKTWGDDPEKNTTDVPIEILKELQVGKYRQCNNTKVS